MLTVLVATGPLSREMAKSSSFSKVSAESVVVMGTRSACAGIAREDASMAFLAGGVAVWPPLEILLVLGPGPGRTWLLLLGCVCESGLLFLPLERVDR